MKLYYAPGACSLASHIALAEAGADYTLERVDTATKVTETGADYLAINPKGAVAALQFDDGQVLTESAAILQYVADQHPQAALAPAAGTLARARLQEQLNYIASELHKAFGPLFDPSASGEAKDAARALVGRRFDHVEHDLSDGRDWLLGDRFSVADAYLFTVSGWAGHLGVDLSPWPKVKALAARAAARPAVQAALRAEGLLQQAA